MYDCTLFLLITGNRHLPNPPDPSPVPPHAPFRAGILNTLGGFYCFKAKSAMAGPKAIAPSS